MPQMKHLALPLTHHLGLPALFEEEIRQRYIQGGSDAFERLQGRHRLAVLELTDEARGDPGMFGEGYRSQPSHLAHTSNLFPQIHRASLALLLAADILGLGGRVTGASVGRARSSP